MPIEKLMAGQYVMYLNIKAQVLAVKKNGIKITYWGKGLKEGQCITHRVSATYLTVIIG